MNAYMVWIGPDFVMLCYACFVSGFVFAIVIVIRQPMYIEWMI